MALKIGNNAVANAFVGSSQVRRAYKGGTLVYQAFGPASEQEFIQQTAVGGPAQLLKCYGKTIVNNQLVQNYDFSDGTNGWTAYRSTASVTGGVATITPTVTDNTAGFATPIAAGTKWIEGHKYAIICRVKGNVGKTINFSAYYGALSGVSAITPTGDWQTSAQIKTATASEAAFTALRVALAQAADANLSPYYCNYIKVIDLTLLYGVGSEPASVAAFLADYPEYDPTYDPGSLQSNKTAELRAKRVPVINVWDEEWTRGSINSDGTEASAGNYYKPTSLIPIQPSTQYWFKKPAGIAQRQAYYDASGSFLSLVDLYNTSGTGGQFTTPSNAFYMKFYIAQYPYQNDICINLSDPAINGTYYPHWRGKLTLNLSTLTSGGVVVFPDGLRGVGTDRDAAYGSTGVVRFGKRAYQAGDESDTSVLTDGTNTIYPLATPLTYTLDTPLPTDLTCEQGDILQRVSDNNCPFVGEMRFGL